MAEIIDLIKAALQDPWMLLYLTVWGLGFFLKEKTRLDNELIPIFLLVLGLGLGLALVELSLTGALAGVLIALAQMGLYDLVKPAIQKQPVIVHGEGRGEDSYVSSD